jgi:hypothetical protein
MKKLVHLCVLVAVVASVFAQQDSPYTARQLKYHDYRLTLTEPPYALSKVKRLIKHLKAGEEGNERMADKAYNSLSFDEKFTYAMIHGEDYVQNCDAMPRIDDEDQRIFAWPPGAFASDTTWSDRQRAFARNNRGIFVSRIRSLIRSRRRVGLNVKFVCMELDAYELIPDLIRAYGYGKKDHDILSVLMVLMKHGQYKPFLASASYKKLYSEDSSYESSLMANEANEKLICDRAMAFYNSGKK